MSTSRPIARLAFAACLLGMVSACGAADPASDPLGPSAAGDDPALADGGARGSSSGSSAPSFAGDAGSKAPPAPLGPVGVWTWIDVPGAICGYGQPTGFEVNVGTSSDVLFYLEGGGLCWDEASCEAGVAALPGIEPAHHFTSGYDEHTFQTEHEQSGIFDRTLANNPFKTSTIVYVPYCTGDFHVGSTTRFFFTAQKTAHWAGRQNLDLFLAKVVPAFPKASRVTLAGSSAGGFGALMNFEHVKDAFGKTRVDLITDSSPALWNNALIFAGLGAWNAAAALPPGCPECQGSIRDLYPYYATTSPGSRLAFTTNDKDVAMSLGGFAVLPYPGFYDAIHDLTVHTLKPLQSWKYFVAGGTAHPLMDHLDAVSQPECCNSVFGFCFPRACGKAETLGDWLTQMATDDPTWTRQTSIIE